MSNKGHQARIIQQLIDWFANHKVDHYFRHNRTPYRVWISEVALQQTRIQAAEKPLKRFFSHFSSLRQLAAASEDEVLHAFQGLGYYNRARNLRRGAQYVMKNHNGKLPQRYDELVKVPSIGDYTAAAISSICFGEKKAVLDGNVKRILSRLLLIDDYISSRAFEQRARNFLAELMGSCSEHPPGDLNEAMMQLGQLVCLKSNPACPKCPLAFCCQAHAVQKQNQLPRKKPPPQPTRLNWQMLAYQVNDRVGLHRPASFSFLAGHDILPSKLVFDDGKTEYSLEATARELFDRAMAKGVLAGTFQHTITRYKITVEVFVTSEPAPAEIDLVKTDQASKKAVSSLMKKALSYFASQKKLPFVVTKA